MPVRGTAGYNWGAVAVIPPSDESARAQMKQWADNWKRVGPILEAERWDRLAAMTGVERTNMAVELLSLYQSDKPGDNDEGLLAIQRAFAKWRPR